MATAKIKKRELRYGVGSGMLLAADAWGGPDGPPVLLLHGGGQTRHAWGKTGEALAAAGFYAISLDLRGHGDSTWASDGDYSVDAYARDLHGVCQTLDDPPALVGASLGGMISLVYAGEQYRGLAKAVVLVDITPRITAEGVDRVLAFMTANPDGFETLEDAARVVSKYLPHRAPPTDLSGLEKNLRRGEDGRWRWHWDPAFVENTARRRQQPGQPTRLLDAARRIDVPSLLVRGRMSEVVSEENVREFLELVPHAEYVDVADAAHMVAGDRNDAFSDAVVEFLSRTAAPPAVAAQVGR